MSEALLLKSVKRRLASLKSRQRFIDYRESGPFAHELEAVLEEIESVVENPRHGIELIREFIETDGAVLGNSDDSNGSIGDVYKYSARDFFVRYAIQCEDKGWLYDVILGLYRQDEYGVRDFLIEAANSFLTEPWLRRMADEFWELALQESGEYRRRHWFLSVEMIARQLKDAGLFERARRTMWPDLSTAACIDIAEVYFESGDTITALRWLERVPPEETVMADARDRLLLNIATRIGDQSRAEQAAWRIFRRYRSAETLSLLLSAVGQEQKDDVLNGEIELIQQDTVLNYSNVDFLIETEYVGVAERYVIDRRDQINGEIYPDLVSWARTFERHERHLVVTIIYRALLDSILRRGISKYYSHGIRYLRKLDQIAPKLVTLGIIAEHENYKATLLSIHKRKFAFWSKYNQ
ncbi:MAG: DUF6880 family protein [Candidatus Zixiibacteriota bacterium]